jgi:hypothetical protein
MNAVNLGKKCSQIAREYGVTLARVIQWAQEHDVQCASFDGGKTVEFYIFDEAAEEAFRNRKTQRGPAAMEKPPKILGKPGRPRIRPINTEPKNPVGRPRKPKEAVDIVPKKRGRPKKK